MKSSVCLHITHKLFQPMILMNFLRLGKVKSLDHAKVSYTFKALRMKMKQSTHNHTKEIDNNTLHFFQDPLFIPDLYKITP